VNVTETKLVNLWLARRSGAVGNSSVEVAPDGDATFRLHGHPIVRVRTEDGARMVEFTFAGWPTSTTRRRINGILGGIGLPHPVRVYQKDRAQFARYAFPMYTSVGSIDSLHEWYLAGTLPNGIDR
jgi:hypothetical protein